MVLAEGCCLLEEQDQVVEQKLQQQILFLCACKMLAVRQESSTRMAEQGKGCYKGSASGDLTFLKPLHALLPCRKYAACAGKKMKELCRHRWLRSN